MVRPCQQSTITVATQGIYTDPFQVGYGITHIYKYTVSTVIKVKPILCSNPDLIIPINVQDPYIITLQSNIVGNCITDDTL